MQNTRYQQIGFRLAPEVARLGVNGAFLTMGGLHNRISDPEFDELLVKAASPIITAVDTASLQYDPVLQGYRQLHDAIGRSNQRFVAAPENLLILARKRGTIPRINLLVDIYNLVSLKTRLALGAHDLSHVSGDIELRFTQGTEPFNPLGVPKPTTVGPGEYAYLDGASEVLCRLEVRQCEKSKVTPETTEAFYIVQGNRATPPDKIRAAVDELVSLTTRFCGGRVRLLQLPD